MIIFFLIASPNLYLNYIIEVIKYTTFTFINTFFATMYPGVFGGHSYIVSLFQNNPIATMQNSWHLYLYAMQQLW